MSVLLLFPTQYERSRILSEAVKGVETAVIGFGPVEGAIGAAAALERHPDPSLCVLAGFAGTYDPERFPPGSVVEVSSFRLYGIGAGTEPDLLLPEEMELPDGVPLSVETAAGPETPLRIKGVERVKGLTVCAASGSIDQAARRKGRFPEGMVEEMEGFSAARICNRKEIPFACFRGIVNVAGDRRKKYWKIDEASSALTEILKKVVK